MHAERDDSIGYFLSATDMTDRTKFCTLLTAHFMNSLWKEIDHRLAYYSKYHILKVCIIAIRKKITILHFLINIKYAIDKVNDADHTDVVVIWDAPRHFDQLVKNKGNPSLCKYFLK